MAKNSFLVFNEQGANMQSDAEYQSSTQRIGGVLPGLAEPEMHNKLYRQTSIMAAAIGKVLAEAGYDASDANMTALAANIKALFVAKPLDSYPVGSIYISASAVSPAQLFGGTWEQIQGKFLLASSADCAAGSTGGEASHTLTAQEMPNHNHAITVNIGGAHTHQGEASKIGGHTHTRGTMNITGRIGADDRMLHTYGGAFYIASWADTGSDGTGGGYAVGFDASRSWTGETSENGAHSHAVSITEGGSHAHTASSANTGSGQAHNNMPPYLAVFVWKRVN